MVFTHSKDGKYGYAQVSINYRLESQVKPWFCNVVELLSYPPYMDANYPLDWQRLIALHFSNVVVITSKKLHVKQFSGAVFCYSLEAAKYHHVYAPC